MDRDVVIRKSLRGGVIVFAAVGLQYVIAFGTQIALARMLEPAHFGALAFATMVAMFFSNFTNIHGDKYIVKEKGNIHQKLDNAFTVELLLSILFIGFVVSVAPFLMKLLGKPELTTFVQFLAFAFLYNPLSKPRSLFERELSFFRAKFPLVFAQLIGGIIGISLAYLDFGIWSLLWWRMSTFAMEALIIWLIAPYLPKLAWNCNVLKGIVGFGWPLLGSSVLVFFYYNIDYYIVGHLLGEEQLGYYWLAFQTSHYFLKAKTAVNSIAFPAYSRLNVLEDRYKSFENITNIMSILYLIPAIAVLFFGEEIILFVFGPKWLPATAAFQIFFVIVLIRAISGNVGPLLYSVGITKAELTLSVLNVLILGPTLYYATLKWGIVGAALSVLFVGIILAAYGCEKYVKPLTGKGFFHYFWKPIFVIVISYFIIPLITIVYSISVFERIIILFAILFVSYKYLFGKSLLRMKGLFLSYKVKNTYPRM